MKKSILCLSAIVFAATLPLFAIDFGTKLNNTTKFQGNTFSSLKWYQSDSVHLWVTELLNEQYKMKLATDGSYEFRYDQSKTSNQVINILDLNLLKFSSSFDVGKGSFQINAGRFSMSDGTGIVFSQVNDGLYLKLALPAIEVGLYGGCTKLLNSQDVSIIGPAVSSYSVDYSKLYYLGPSYIPAGLTLSFPSLFLNQTVSVEAWGFPDFSSDQYNRWYGTVGLSGPLSRNIFYSLMTTAETEKFTGVSDLSQASIVFYPAPAASLTLSGIYASGANGFLQPFVGFTTQTADLAFDEPSYSGLIKGSLSGSYTILSTVCISAEGSAVFTCPKSEVKFDGWQWKADVMWNIFSDLQLSVGGYQYYAINDASRNKTCLSVTGSLVL